MGLWIALAFAASLPLLILWQFIRPSTRARAIEAAKGAKPRNLTDRDKAYVLELYERFGDEPFKLYRFKKVYLAERIADRFGVKSGRVDDAGMIGNRLPRHGFLIAHRAGKYQLTAAAVDLAQELASLSRLEEPEKPNG